MSYKLNQLHAVCLSEQSRRTERHTLRSLLSPLQLSSTSSYMLFGWSSCFLRDLPPLSLILCFRRSTKVSSQFSYRLPFRHKSFFIPHSFDVPKPAENVLLHSHRDILASTCYSGYLFIAELRLRISYEEFASPHTSSFFHSSAI